MKRFMIIIAVAVAFAAAGACEKYDDGKPSRSVRAEFERMYPDAWDVEWEYQGDVWEVSFETGTRPNGIEYKAWFDMDGNWIDTVKDM